MGIADLSWLLDQGGLIVLSVVLFYLLDRRIGRDDSAIDEIRSQVEAIRLQVDSIERELR